MKRGGAFKGASSHALEGAASPYHTLIAVSTAMPSSNTARM